MNDKKNSMQRIWGIALVFMGAALIFRVPEIIEKLKDTPLFVSGRLFVQFCFYFMSLVLIVGGIKKILPSKPDNDKNQS